MSGSVALLYDDVMNLMTMDRNWRIVVGVGVAAGFLAILLSILNGSHFAWKTGDSGTSFDIRIGGEGGLPVSILGTISILCLLLGSAFLAASKSAPEVADAEAGGSQSPVFSFLTFLKELRRSNSDVWLGGVCGGLGTYSPVPTWVWRVVFLVLVLSFGTGLLAYIILWICMPKQVTAEFSAPVPPPVPPTEAPR